MRSLALHACARTAAAKQHQGRTKQGRAAMVRSVALGRPRNEVNSSMWWRDALCTSTSWYSTSASTMPNAWPNRQRSRWHHGVASMMCERAAMHEHRSAARRQRCMRASACTQWRCHAAPHLDNQQHSQHRAQAVELVECACHQAVQRQHVPLVQPTWQAVRAARARVWARFGALGCWMQPCALQTALRC